MKQNVWIYYFTGTGNSLKIAQKVKIRLEREGYKVNLEDISGKRNLLLDLNNITLGFCFPVYAYGLPRIIKRFMEKLPEANGTEAFLIATNGGEVGGTLKQGRHLLEKRGYNVTGVQSIHMPNNYVVGRVLKDEENLKQIQCGELVAENFVTYLLNDRTKEQRVPKVWAESILGLVSASYLPMMNYLTRQFYADEDCNGCGYCAKICPMKSIDMTEGEPKWFNTCEHCFRCINHCPREAIQTYGKTKGKRRYRLLPFKEGV